MNQKKQRLKGCRLVSPSRDLPRVVKTNEWRIYSREFSEWNKSLPETFTILGIDLVRLLKNSSVCFDQAQPERKIIKDFS
jgi:hypothetical protein